MAKNGSISHDIEKGTDKMNKKAILFTVIVFIVSILFVREDLKRIEEDEKGSDSFEPDSVDLTPCDSTVTKVKPDTIFY